MPIKHVGSGTPAQPALGAGSGHGYAGQTGAPQDPDVPPQGQPAGPRRGAPPHAEGVDGELEHGERLRPVGPLALRGGPFHLLGQRSVYEVWCDSAQRFNYML